MAAGARPLVDPEQLVRSHTAPACNLVERVATKIAVTCSPGGMLVREIRELGLRSGRRRPAGRSRLVGT